MSNGRALVSLNRTKDTSSSLRIDHNSTFPLITSLPQFSEAERRPTGGQTLDSASAVPAFTGLLRGGAFLTHLMIK